MENDVLDSLEDLGYDGPLMEANTFAEAIEGGAKSVAFTQCVEWMVSQIVSFCNCEEKVSPIQGPDDSEIFLMELSGFLREISCPYTSLTDGPIEGRLASKQACLQLLDFLLTELSSVRMIATNRPAYLVTTSDATPTEPTESDVARYLKEMLIALKFSKPPADITEFQLFSKIESKVQELTSKYPDQKGSALLKARLSDKQWAQIMAMNSVLADEYRVRREMLLKRLDVTIQSFRWSEKAKNNDNKIAEVYQPIRKELKAKTDVGVPQILAARDDLTRLQKTSSGLARETTKCAINKVLIGRVPDRGGRAWELEPPPPEMPSFMKRDAGSDRGRGGGRGGGGGGGRGGGGRVQGGWGDNQNRNVGGNWNQGGGGYQQGGRGGYQGGGGGGGGGGGYQGGGGGGYQGGGGGGYQGGRGGYQGGGGGGYQGGGGGGYQGGGGGGGYQGGGGGGYQGGGGGYQGGGGGNQGGGGGGRGGYQDGGYQGRGRGGRGGGRGGRGRY